MVGHGDCSKLSQLGALCKIPAVGEMVNTFLALDEKYFQKSAFG